MKTLIKKISGALLIFQLLSAVVIAGELVEKFDKSFQLQPGQQFYLKNTNGSVRVYGWDKNEVRVEAVKRVKSGSRSQADELMKQVQIEVDQEGDRLSIVTITPKSGSSSFLSWLFDGFSSHSIEVKYTIWLPGGVQSEIRTVNGSIYVKDLNGEAELKSTNGRISVENAAGLISASTTNGSVSIELVKVDPESELRVRTTNGSIKLYLPEDFGGEIVARTTNGSIKTDFPIQLTGKIGRNRLRGTIGDGTVKCDLATTNGSIKIFKIE